MNRFLGFATILSSVVLSLPGFLRAETADPVQKIAKMNLEQLMSVQVAPAMMTSASVKMIPASVTTISEEDIRLTPAKNIFDLLEVYVPGALWTYHNEGQHLSLRGLSSDRETKILLLVNGFKINQDAFAGAVDELINWDLNDIKEIQVIRGPGSVTYGPGAIEGVINIITKDFRSAPGLAFGTKYVSPFRSKGGYLSAAKEGEKIKAYAYATGTWTQGHTVDTFDVDQNGTYGFIGQGGFQNNRTQPNWYNDWRTRPQLKFHTQVDFAKEWRFWARYNQAGFTHEPAVADSKLASSDSSYLFERQLLNRYALFVLENSHTFSKAFILNSEVGFHTYDRIKDEATPKSFVRENAKNRNPVFGSNRFVTKVVGNIAFTPRYEIALGVSHVNEFVGHGWNRDPRDMFIYGIVNGADSNASTIVYSVGKGWYAQTFSAMAEANLKFHPKLNVVLSGRADKHDYTDYLFSPRVAVLSDMGRAGVYKLIAQRAQRMNDSSELWIAHRAGVKPPPEELQGVEFIWNSPANKLLDVSLSSFCNKTQLLGFNQTKLSVTHLGDVTIAGVELEIKRQTKKYTVGASHSYADLVKFKLGTDVPIASISYADARTITGGGTMIVGGTGDNLNNWANHSTKVYFNYRVIPGRITLHGDARVFWAFEGKKDALQMFQDGMDSVSPADQVIIQNNLDFLRSQDVGGIDCRVDASAEFKVTEPLTVIVWGQNIVNGLNHRYGYDGGANRIYPTRFETTLEPATVGVRMDYRF